MTLVSVPSSPNPARRLIRLCALFCLELLLLAAAYQFFVVIECHLTDVNGACRFLRSLVARALVVFAVGGLLLWAMPMLRHAVLRAAGQRAGALWPGVHAAGLVLLVLPLAMAPGGNLGAVFDDAIWFLGAGAILAGVGGVMWVAPAVGWRDIALAGRGIAPGALILAALLPDIADLALPLWNLDGMSAVTFAAVRLFLEMFATDILIDAPARIIGFPAFSVHIAPQCSGVEGVALVTAFTLIYALIFRESLRLSRLFLVVLPAAVLLSLLFNVVRVGTLILIGRYISPDLAVNGFHSYAGWVFFTLLAFGIVWGVQVTPWLHRTNRLGEPDMPLRDDPVAAFVIPFVAFMVASLITHAFFAHPEIGYPLRVVAMAAALWPFRRYYLRLVWRLDPVAWTLGALVGLGWLLFDQGDPEAGMAMAVAIGALPKVYILFWVVVRLIGTVAFVPFVEELFFRGYLLTRFTDRGPAGAWVALALSTLCFAALHGRWISAGVAGLLFALIAWRRGGVTSAIQAHVAANLVVAVWAYAVSDFSKI